MAIKTQSITCLSGIPVDYPGLIAMFPLRPIYDRVDADNATEIVDAMAGQELTSDQEDYLDVLSTLLDELESRNELARISPNKPLANLRRLIVGRQMNASDPGRVLGNRALGSKILRGERRLGLNHITRLMKHFAVDATAFL
jgi:antitoxin component HigA of HigAB toxin-antitoxin module